MADDELSAPLGKGAKAKKQRRRFRLPIRIPHLIAALLGSFVLAWVVVTTSHCATGKCILVSPVDANTGRVLDPNSFSQPPG